MLLGIEDNVETAILANVLYGANVDLQDFFTRFGQNHFSESNCLIYAAAKELWVNNKDIHSASLKLMIPECSASIDDLATIDAMYYVGYEKTLKDIADKKRMAAFLKETLYSIENGRISSGEASDKLQAFIEHEDHDFDFEATTIYDIMQKEVEIYDTFKTGLSFVDSLFKDHGDGFQYGNVITITGEQEAGKTQLLNQILFGGAERNQKSLYFSLEFNEHSFQLYMRKKVAHNGVDREAMKNIWFVTDEQTSGNIYELESIIRKYHKKHGLRVIGIDSQMMLDAEGIDIGSKSVSKSEEAMITKIYRVLHKLAHKLNILIFVIAQGSKSDNAAGRVEIFGSKRAGHLAKVMLHMEKDFIEKDEESNAKKGESKEFKAGVYEPEEQYYMRVAKNKMSGRHPRVALNFDKSSLEFWVEFVDKVSGRSKGPQVIEYAPEQSYGGFHAIESALPRATYPGIGDDEPKLGDDFFNDSGMAAFMNTN